MSMDHKPQGVQVESDLQRNHNALPSASDEQLVTASIHVDTLVEFHFQVRNQILQQKKNRNKDTQHVNVHNLHISHTDDNYIAA